MLRNLLGLGMLLNTESFQRGYQAAQEGVSKSQNPHSKRTPQWSDWQLGWHAAATMTSMSENRSVALRIPTQTAYEMGMAAGESGVSASANPYHYGHPGHREWRLGWATSRSKTQ